MQVNDPNLQGLSNQATSGTERTQKAVDAARTPPVGKNDARSDEVEISSFAQQVNELHEGSSAREARVTELQELVQSGRYEVDAAGIASRLIDDSFPDKE